MDRILQRLGIAFDESAGISLYADDGDVEYMAEAIDKGRYNKVGTFIADYLRKLGTKR